VKVSQTGRIAGLVLSGSLALAACGTDTQDPAAAGAAVTPTASGSSAPCAAGELRGAGSSFQKNIVAQWIKDFAGACTGANVDYQGVGSGAGIKQFTAGTVDFAGSDAVMKDSEQADADKRCGGPAVHLPLTAGGVAVAYNLDGVTDLQLSPKVLAGIFQGTITRWDDAAVKADNPSATLPSQAITAVRRSDSSGTTAIFTEFLTATAKADWKLGAGKEVDWPSSVQGAAKSDGVTQAAKGVKGAITYVESSFASGAALGVAKVQNSAGEYAALDAASVTKALDTVAIPGGNDLKLAFDYAALGAGTYPLTGVTYEIVCTTGNAPAMLPLLKAFLTYSATTGQAAAEGLDYAPLPVALASKVTATVATLA
jgi:phosphate transport system substrate-binding protein